MDRKSSLTDAYVEIRFAEAEALRTNICKKSLNPVWNEDFRLEVGDDISLQDEPLELRVVDYDSITYDDLIGSVFFDLNSLLMTVYEPNLTIEHPFNAYSKSSRKAEKKDSKSKHARIAGANIDIESNSSGYASENSSDTSNHNHRLNLKTSIAIKQPDIIENKGGRTMSGWFPIFDTQNGIRGELQCQIKLEFFGDVNPLRESSAGIRILSINDFIYSKNTKVTICKFIDSLITMNDPEHHWSDSFRTQRTSNETRQRLLYQLSGQLRRKMGRKAIELGANAIIGYKHSFDFEEKNKTITGRAIGTAIFLENVLFKASKSLNKINFQTSDSKFNAKSKMSFLNPLSSKDKKRAESIKNHIELPKSGKSDSTSPPNSVYEVEPFNSKNLSASDGNTDDPNYYSLQNHDNSLKSNGFSKDMKSSKIGIQYSKGTTRNKVSSNNQSCELLTLNNFPPSLIYRLGGAVMARSVKVIDNDEEKDRVLWWEELRNEIRSHALSLGCSHVTGYSESCTIFGDVVVLTSVGTAAVLDFSLFDQHDTDSNMNRFNGVSTHFTKKNESSKDSDPKSSVSSHNSAKNQSRIHDEFAGQSSHDEEIKPNNSHGSSDSSEGRKDIHLNDSFSLKEYAEISKLDTSATSSKKKGKMFTRARTYSHSKDDIFQNKPFECRMCHAPDDKHSFPYPMRYFRCGYCRKKSVPEIILSTSELPKELDIIQGEAALIEAHICRPRSRSSVVAVGVSGEKHSNIISASLGRLGINRSGGDSAGGAVLSGSDEAYAAFISDALPFIQYDLHRQLLYKLSVYGMNAIFGLHYHLSLSEEMIIATAIGTAYYVSALPTPENLVISRNIGVWDEEDRGFLKLQDRITNLSTKNRNRLDKKFRLKAEALAKNSSVEKEETYFAKYHRDGKSSNKTDSIAPGISLEKRNLLKKDLDTQSQSEQDNDAISHQSDKLDIITKSTSRVAVNIDDDADEDLMAALFDHPLNKEFNIINTSGDAFLKDLVFQNKTDDILSSLSQNSVLSNEMYKKKNYRSKKSDSSAPISEDDFYDESDNRQSGSALSLQYSSKLDNKTSAKKLVSSPLNSLSISDKMIRSSSFSNQEKEIYLDDSISAESEYSVLEKSEFSQLIFVAKRLSIDIKSKHPNRLLANVFNQTYQEICSNLSYYSKCVISGLKYSLANIDESPGEIQLLLIASVFGKYKNPIYDLYSNNEEVYTNRSYKNKKGKKVEIDGKERYSLTSDAKEDYFSRNSESFSNDKGSYLNSLRKSKLSIASYSRVIDSSIKKSDSNVEILFAEDDPVSDVDPFKSVSGGIYPEHDKIHSKISRFVEDAEKLPKLPSLKNLTIDRHNSEFNFYLGSDNIELTSLSHLCGRVISSMLGRISLNFVKEVSIEAYTKGPIGMPAFVYSFLADANASIRSHIEALQGNALICLSIDHQQFFNSDKSTAYAMVSISGDVVFAE
ncbi:hypothetical protein BB560_000837 [Smittium megazygosporum]|uniref:C2 domain-containing protein n=1 Tax=Smittium megazygosporum TaxID=133381 RepID=A0A2T9ZJA0_9FUNG|nr:hypothetical protein BB560_000837 [Smittium megazygosporum]